jgi:hypothetical protein
MKTGNVMHNIKTKVSTTTTTDYSLELSGDDIRRLLGIPPDARVSVHIPGGGDWSNQALDLNDRDTLDINWQEVDEA